MLISVSNNLTVENPSLEMVMWCRQNLVKPNPEFLKKSRMGFWTGDVPKTISLYEIRGANLVLPYGLLNQIPKEITDGAIFIKDFKLPIMVDYHADVPLYDYQEIAVQAMIDAKYGILQSAAGSGKTQMGIALATRLKRRTLWLCHTKDLIKQSKDRAELYMSEDLTGTITEGQVHIGEGITFATIQTMCKLDLAQYKHYWDVIIVDEAHRASGTPTSITQYQIVLNSLSARHKYGLSATPHRADGLIEATYALIGKVAYRVPDSAVADKVMKVGICPVGTGIEISREALNTDGTVNFTRLVNYLANSGYRNSLIVKEIVNEQGKPSLILSDRLEQLESLITMLPVELRKDAVMISGGMTTKRGKAEREQAIENMRTGKKKYLFATYSLAREGLDIPCLERLYMATPQKDYAVITQSIGRIARTCEGKEDPVVYDFVDDIGTCVKFYKKRCTTYRKNHCYFLEGKNANS